MPLTLAYCLTLVAATILFDAAQYARGGWEATISYLVLTRAQRYPIIPFTLGVIVGHLLWPQPMPPDDPRRDDDTPPAPPPPLDPHAPFDPFATFPPDPPGDRR